jgi:hypothetical protein
MTKQCIARAKSLSMVCAAYAWNQHEDDQVFDEVYLTLQVLDDLLELAYRGLEFWPDEHRLIRNVWKPPVGPEGPAL